MNCDVATKMNGINTWFIIEIFSFYGYILGAIIYIFTNICKSSCGLKDKRHMLDKNDRDKETAE